MLFFVVEIFGKFGWSVLCVDLGGVESLIFIAREKVSEIEP